MLFTSLGGVCLCTLLRQLSSVSPALHMWTDYGLKNVCQSEAAWSFVEAEQLQMRQLPPPPTSDCLCHWCSHTASASYALTHDVCERDQRKLVCDRSSMWLTARMRSSLHQTPLHMAASQTWNNAHHTHSFLASFISLSCLCSLAVASFSLWIFARDESVDKMMILYSLMHLVM